MSDMFPGASSIGDSLKDLFGGPQDASAAYYKSVMDQNRENRATSIQNQGVQSPNSIRAGAESNGPGYGNEKNKAAATEDPLEVEARWQARLIKFAGLANATGVKLGS